MSSGDEVKQPPTTQEATGSVAQAAESKSAPAPSKTEGDEKPSTTQPLAPPPKPSQQQQNNGQPNQTPDYFGGNHNNFSLEPNPFEQSFGNPSSTETPGKVGGLPPVASLTSPAPLGPGGTPNWSNSLRSGPLSPAMLQGPVNSSNGGYFDQEFRNNYPTPNESSLRTGLTPGGGGSMFPAPSPNTAAIFNLSGGVTPGTAEFQRAAATARQQKGDAPATTQADSNSNNNMSKQEYQPAQQQGRSDPFGANQQEHEAVNSLYMLAQPNNRSGANANQFAVPNQQNMSQTLANMNIQQRMQAQQHDSSPTASRNNNSLDLGRGNDEDEDMDDEKPATRSKGKKGSASKASGAAANGRRKADETPSKAPSKKRTRGNNGSVNSFDEDSDDPMDIKDDIALQQGSNGKKMTDEEKRKNFLERNRVAALKCRQRKKQWLANLQTKVEIFTQENDALTQQCGQLREEIINLKTLLLAHKDCPVSHQQGLGGQNMAQFMGNIDPNGQAHFGMMGQGNMPMAHMQGQGQGIQQGIQPGQGVQRR